MGPHKDLGDLTLAEFANLEESRPELIQKLRELWVGEYPDREHEVRIGSLYLTKDEEWSGVCDNLVLTLRFSLT